MPSVLFVGVASAVDVDYIISPDTLMLNTKAPYFAVEIDNSNPNYDVHDIDPFSIEISIQVKGADSSSDKWVSLGSLELVKKNPEINEELNKLVLMYYTKDLYNFKLDNGVTVLDYFKEVCGADGVGQVNFQIRGEFNDGSDFSGSPFMVDLMVNKRSGGKSGKSK